MEISDRAPAIWTAPECPFTIEYSPRVLDDIRLAVVDAFCSLPRGGLEIGGILLGKHVAGRLRIDGLLAMDCEHAFGPSFTLSPNDRKRLEQLLAEARRTPGGLEPVGWYHSHTRSQVFLSEADLEIHARYFPEPWQVALVLKPHTFEPARAGFFFRGRDGSIHAASSLNEFTLEPLPLRLVPSAQPAPGPAPEPAPGPAPAAPRGSSMQNGPVIDVESAGESVAAAPDPKPAAAREPAPAPTPFEIAPPRFTTVHQGRSRRWIAVAAILLGLGVGAAGYQMRETWLPQLSGLWSGKVGLPEGPGVPASSGPAAPAPAAPVSAGLSALDSGGQLMIRWDRGSAPILHGTGALLTIADGGATPQAIGLDKAHLQAGSFTYVRQTGHVEVTLTVHWENGPDLREIATFLGPAPDRTAGGESDASKLEKQAARTKKLEKTVSDMRSEMQKDQRRRLENQSPDSVKK